MRQIGLGINPTREIPKAGDALTIVLSEPPNQQVSWSIDVYAKVGGDGPNGAVKTFVGTIQTSAAGVGGQLCRAVGYALCPGATSWYLEATGPGAGFGAYVRAYLDAEVTSCCTGPGLGAGVFNIQGRVITTGGTLAASRTDFGVPVLFRGFFGSNESGAQGWLMLFDSATLPPNGTAPVDGISIDLASGADFNLSLDPPILLQNGLTWALSTTPGTLTVSLNELAAQVTTRVVW